MNYRLTKTFAVLALAAISLASLQDGVLIRRVLKENSKDTYKVESVTKFSVDTPAGAQEGSATTLTTIEAKMGALKDNGSAAAYTMTTTTDKLEMDGMMGANAPTPDKVPPVTIEGIIDSQNRITGAKPVGKASMNPMQMLGGSEAAQFGLFVQFPDKAVKEGDTWTINVPASMMTGKEAQTLTAKFVGTRDVDGQKLYVVSVSGKVKIEPDMDAMKKAMTEGGNDPTMGMDLKIKGTADIDAENLIDPATGSTVSAKTHVKGATDVEIVQMSMQMKATSDTTVKMTLKK